jgi:hypothetical protein
VEDNINNNDQVLGGGGRGLAVHASMYGKVQAKPTVKPNNQEEEKERKDACFGPCWAV